MNLTVSRNSPTFAGMTRKPIRILLLILGSVALITTQLVWLCNAYQLKHQQLTAYVKDAFELAYQKEQTYRIPVVDIINPGELTIQSCGKEEVLIIRSCPEPDTIIYSNTSGHSIETFMNRVFGDLRGHIVPLNIHCLADLFGGMLHDGGIAALFVIERFDVNTKEVLETSLLPGKPQVNKSYETVAIEISDSEVIRALVQLTPSIILGQMAGTLAAAACLLVFALLCLILLFRCRHFSQKTTEPLVNPVQSQVDSSSFAIGSYTFDPAKNELQGFGETIQLNKKENAILHTLCMNLGNVVERNTLLEESWGNNGAIYSRSLDTYLTTLRKYLKQDPMVQIITIKSVGYKLVVSSS